MISPTPAAGDAGCREVYPRLIDGVGEWSFFARTDRQHAIYIIGSLDIDRYVTVPERVIESMRTILRLLDGQHSIEDIEAYLRQHQRKNVDVAAICRRLTEAGLIVSPAQGVEPRSDLDAMMLGVTDITMGHVPRPLREAITRAAPIAAAATGAAIAIGSVLYVIDPWPASAATPSMLSLPLMLLSCAVHECAHALAAIHFGLSPRRLRAAFFLGIFPFIYFRLGGLYTLAPLNRVIVWGAGIFTNLGIASTLVVLLHYGLIGPGYENVARTVAVGNYTLAFLNLFPFLPTDGYFIAMTLCRAHNLRGRSWRTMTSLVRGTPTGDSPFVVLYLMGAVIAIGGMIVYRVSRTAQDPHGGMALALGSLVLVAFALWTSTWSAQSRAGWRGRVMRFVRWAAVLAGLYLSGVLTPLIRFAAVLFSLEPVRRIGGQHQLALTLVIFGAYAAIWFATRPSRVGARGTRMRLGTFRLLAAAATIASCALLFSVQDAGVTQRAVWIVAIVAWLSMSGRLRGVSRTMAREAI